MAQLFNHQFARMPDPPPLDCLRFFDAAARHENFVRAAEELAVAPAAVAHRIGMLESHLQAPLFDRYARGAGLNSRGANTTPTSGAYSRTSGSARADDGTEPQTG